MSQHIDHRVEEMLTLVCEHVKIPRPKWEWCNRKVSRYQRWTIYLSQRDWHGLEDALLHELAHHWDFITYNRVHHDIYFFRHLKDLTSAWYGDASKYGWNKEYATIMGYAVYYGLLETKTLPKFEIGQEVYFRDRALQGKIVGINYKTVTVQTAEGCWKVHKAAAEVV